MNTTEQATKGLFLLAERLPWNIAPEKAKELLREVFSDEGWTILPSRTDSNFYAVVGDRAIYLSFAGLASLWCISMVAYWVMDIGSRQAREVAKGKSQLDISKAWHDLSLDSYVNYACRLMQKDEAWPNELEKPDSDADIDTVPGRLNNLFFGALSWVILHEIAHVHHDDQIIAPSFIRVKQEFEADSFATSWILDEAGTGLKREFRAISIVVALAWLLLHEKVIGPGYDHPRAFLRFRETIEKLNLGTRSVGLEYSSYFLKALFDPQSEMPEGMLASESFSWVAERISQQLGK